MRSSRPAGTSASGRSARCARATNTLESGWIPCPLPAVFTGDDLKAYREWPSPTATRERGLLGGSYYADDISGYYLTPHDLRYWPFVKFDYDFVGEALEAIADEPRRKKVTLAWNGEDVARAIAGCSSRRATPRSTSTSRSERTRPGRTTSCCTTARRSVSRPSPLQLQRALVPLPGDGRRRRRASAPR